MLFINRDWLKYSAWEVLDENLSIEHFNIPNSLEYETILYTYNNNKGKKICKFIKSNLTHFVC